MKRKFLRGSKVLFRPYGAGGKHTDGPDFLDWYDIIKYSRAVLELYFNGSGACRDVERLLRAL